MADEQPKKAPRAYAKLDTMAWKRVREDFVELSMSVPAVAKKYNIPKSTVKSRCISENWVLQRREFHLTTSETVSEDAPLDEKINWLKRHSGMTEAFFKTIDDVRMAVHIDANITPRSKAEMLKMLTESLDKTIRLHRFVKGIPESQPSWQEKTDVDGYQFIVISKNGDTKGVRITPINPIDSEDDSEGEEDIDEAV